MPRRHDILQAVRSPATEDHRTLLHPTCMAPAVWAARELWRGNAENAEAV